MDKILENYRHENPGVLANLYRILNHGLLAGTGKMIILPVDQGFEHGPDKSFAPNPPAYDPLYHLELAINSGVNAYAAPLGMLEIAASFAPGKIPLILKLNSSNSLKHQELEPDQALTSSPEQALTLGALGIGITIYPGSNNFDQMLEEVQKNFAIAKKLGLVCILWSYPRGKALPNETSLETICYAAHLAAMTGAHIIKVKIPTAGSEADNNAIIDRIKAVKRAAFAGRRLVLFSGGASKDSNTLLEEVRALAEGGANGSIMGRNLFQRPQGEAIALVKSIVDIYKNFACQDKNNML
jgi:class I fructose-bisphosphate aldolase